MSQQTRKSETTHERPGVMQNAMQGLGGAITLKQGYDEGLDLFNRASKFFGAPDPATTQGATATGGEQAKVTAGQLEQSYAHTADQWGGAGPGLEPTDLGAHTAGESLLKEQMADTVANSAAEGALSSSVPGTLGAGIGGIAGGAAGKALGGAIGGETGEAIGGVAGSAAGAYLGGMAASAATGAASGAASGAAAGSAVGPWGTAAGAVIRTLSSFLL